MKTTHTPSRSLEKKGHLSYRPGVCVVEVGLIIGLPVELHEFYLSKDYIVFGSSLFVS